MFPNQARLAPHTSGLQAGPAKAGRPKRLPFTANGTQLRYAPYLQTLRPPNVSKPSVVIPTYLDIWPGDFEASRSQISRAYRVYVSEIWQWRSPKAPGPLGGPPPSGFFVARQSQWPALLPPRASNPVGFGPPNVKICWNHYTSCFYPYTYNPATTQNQPPKRKRDSIFQFINEPEESRRNVDGEPGILPPCGV
jgi:hypothetical protein